MENCINIAKIKDFGYIIRTITSMKALNLHASGISLPVGKILCLGRNYANHAKEMNSELPSIPVVFLKPASSIIYNGEDIVKPPFSNDMHHEVELVVAIAKAGNHINEADALNYVLGYGVGLDMTLRDVQAEAKKKGDPWFTAKGFHTSAALSDIIPAGRIPDPQNLRIRCLVNGQSRQNSSTRDMIFSVRSIISYLSTVVELEAGDLIYTGTPEGVGTVHDGDRIEAELEGFIRTTHHIRFATT